MSDGDTTDLSVAITIIVISVLVYAPISIHYLIHFYRLSDLMIIKKRYPCFAILLSKAIIIYLIIDVPLYALTQKNFFGAKYDNEFEILRRIVHCSLPIGTHAITFLIALRCWLLFFDLKWAMADRNSVWKYHLNPSLTRSDFWLKNKDIWGTTGGYTRKIAAILFIITSIISIALFQLFMYHPNPYLIAYSVNASFHVIPGIFIIILWIKTDIDDDKFFIRQEFKLLSIAIIGGLLAFIAGLIIMQFNNKYLGSQISVLVASTIFFLMSIISTMFIRTKIILNIKLFNNVIESSNNKKRKSSGTYKSDIGFLFGEFGSSLIQSSGPRNNNIIDGIELPSMNNIQIQLQSLSSSISSDIDQEMSKSIKLFHIMTNGSTFDIFMNHLSTEFSMELLLSFLTIVQWKRHFYGCYSDTNNGKKHIKTEQCHHKCPFGVSIPTARIVLDAFRMDNNDRDYRVKKFNDNESLMIIAKKSAHYIYNKYIKPGTAMEVNISHSLRTSLTSVLSDLNSLLLNININVDELFAIFDGVAEEQYKLMNFSFTRFNKSPEWSKVVYILSKQQLYKPEMKK